MTRAWGIRGKNKEQKESLYSLLNPEIDLVVLEGIAGSGKTLLALAAGLEQVVEQKMYKEIIFTRAPVSVGDDMGFLPGTEFDKMAPWAGALEDNLEVLIENKVIKESILETKIQLRAMQFMRGRSFLNKYVILDEVQNLTEGQLKVLLTRAGDGCKIICLGDIKQIDNKKVNQFNNALTLLINSYDFAEVPFVAIHRLPECERSRLAKWAAEVL